jgi:hypothetical protein
VVDGRPVVAAEDPDVVRSDEDGACVDVPERQVVSTATSGRDAALARLAVDRVGRSADSLHGDVGGAAEADAALLLAVPADDHLRAGHRAENHAGRGLATRDGL